MFLSPLFPTKRDSSKWLLQPLPPSGRKLKVQLRCKHVQKSSGSTAWWEGRGMETTAQEPSNSLDKNLIVITVITTWVVDVDAGVCEHVCEDVYGVWLLGGEKCIEGEDEWGCKYRKILYFFIFYKELPDSHTQISTFDNKYYYSVCVYVCKIRKIRNLESDCSRCNFACMQFF